MPKLRRGNLRLQTKHLYPYIVCEHNWFDANNWHCQYLASQHLAKSKFAKCWQLFVRLRRKVGSQPITSQHLAFAKYWHANFWHQTNHALTLKVGRWMKPIRRYKDGKSEHYWPLDIIYIPPDFATRRI